MLQIINNQEIGQNTNLNESQVIQIICTKYITIIDNLDTSAKTIKKYKCDAKMFIDYIKINGLNLYTFTDYKKHLKELQEISTRTKNNKLVVAKLLLKNLFSRGILKIDLTASTKLFTVSTEHVKDGLTKEEIAAVKSFIDKEEDQLKKSRLLALFYLLAFQGLRQFEAANITIEDLRLSENCLFIKGKGRDMKERIDLHPQTKEALQHYITLSNKKSGFIFTGISNRSNSAAALSTRSIRRIFSDIFQQIGLKNKTVHGFRHYFVTTFLKVFKGDILLVQKFSRHKSISAVKMYDDRKKKKELLPAFYSAFSA